ncbi:MAG: prolyl oligopeptidase family serine peptidase [Blautia sp.]|nr:prolyl oligopeptidase family serine peptidase [Blautia sp.]
MLEVKKLPEDMSVFPVDKKDMKRCPLEGLFEEEVKVGEEKRSFYTYLAPGLHYNQPCLVVAPPSGADVLSFLEEGAYLSLAREQQFFLHVLIPGGEGWNKDGVDADYMNRVYVQIQARTAYVTMQDNIYALGVGDGADVAQQAVMKMSSEWAGLATFGDLTDKALLNANATLGGEETGKTELSIQAVKAPVPVWMVLGKASEENEAVKAYWMTQNDVDPTPFSSSFAQEVYFPSGICKSSQVNEEKLSQVRLTMGFEGKVSEGLLKEVWAFLSSACRHRGFGHKMLRRRLVPEDYGFVKRTISIQGYERLYYEYVPETVKRMVTKDVEAETAVVKAGTAGKSREKAGEKAIKEKKVPLVVCMHGRGGSAESFLSLSGLSRVAEERGFIACFPEAGIYQQRPTGIKNILLWNGSYEGEDIDDVGFILAMVKEEKDRYPIDAGRVYACGQSSGGMMTSKLALSAPEVFAAVSPWSAIVDPERPLVLPENITPPVPYFFLFGEKDWLCADPLNGEMEFHVAKDIASFLRNLIKIYGLGEPGRYQVGEISYYVYRNEKGVPMLTVGVVAEMTHANYPRESWISYDEFFAKFSRAEDGRLLYLGEPACE